MRPNNHPRVELEGETLPCLPHHSSESRLEALGNHDVVSHARFGETLGSPSNLVLLNLQTLVGRSEVHVQPDLRSGVLTVLQT